MLKYIYSEKATKFCEIFILLLSYVMPVKSEVKILQNFVAFSEYMYFNKNILFSGLIAVPINCMMSVTGNCSYKYDKNYVLPNYTCRLEKDNTTFVVQEKYASYHRSDFIYFHSWATLTKSL